MLKDKSVLIKEYLKKVKSANKELTKKEAFKDLLNRLYAGNAETESIIDEITLGAEKTIVNIPRKDRLHSGSADTLYNKIIIEYENDLRVSLKHAKEQLAGYLLGEFSRGEGYNFTLIASDFITWRVFAPNVEQLDELENLREDEVVLDEIVSASFTLNEHNVEDFYFWIDRFLFKEEKQKATLKRIEEAFGYQSNIFIESFRELNAWFNEAKKYGEVQVSYEQWKKFLSIAYGKFEASEKIFLIHTYLSVFSKMLAYSIVSNDDYIDEEEMKGILDGEIFNRFNIRNFIDNDFFHWVKSDRNFRNIKKAFRLIAQEISTFDFNNIDEDVLKGVYQELIDLDTRHSLGEYYTPDWLCERIVNEFDFKETDKILDPACGSGSFLRAAVHRMKTLNPEITPEELSNQIYGIDIHPLSVQIAKTTLLLALGKEIRNLKRPVHLNVILSNTLKIPEGVRSLFGSDFRMDIDKDNFLINSQILEDLALFDVGVDVCEELAEQTLHQKKVSIVTLENSLRKQYKSGGITQQIAESFYKIYEGLKEVKEKGRDSIWKFILQNLYKPYFLSGKFDYIIGNPPWFTYSSIKNEEYQNTLNELAEKYNIKTYQKGTFASLEIAAIFLAHCSSYFLKDSGKIAFVLPRSIFNGAQHDNTRSGKTKGFRLNSIWDLSKVEPLFRIPSAVLFGEKAENKKSLPLSGLNGILFKAKLPFHNCNLKEAGPHLMEESTLWFYVKQGKSSAFSNKNIASTNKINYYKKHFKAGATLRPRVFCFIELAQEMPPDFDNRTLNIITLKTIQNEAKKPWKGLEFGGRIQSRFIFRTAMSKSILPFALYQPDLITLPITIEKDKNSEKVIKLLSSDDLRQEGYLDAAKWFQNVENIWKIHRTSLNKKYNSSEYLNFQNKITSQNINASFLVLYNSLGKDANALVVNRKEQDLPFIVDYKSYVYFTNSEKEAFYLSAILNSSIPNLLMKDFI